MNVLFELAERLAVPWFWFMADWSLRWCVLLAPLMAWMAMRRPGRAEMRHRLCLLALLAGALLPLAPAWGVAHAPHDWLGMPSSKNAPKEHAARAFPVPHEARPTPPPMPVEFAAPDILPNIASVKTTPIRTSIEHLPDVRALGWFRWMVLGMGAFWLLGLVAFAARRAAGWRFLARMKSEATVLDGPAARLLDECRAALGVSRTVRLMAHDGCLAPVLWGGWRPAIMVPRDWCTWPENDRRACLTHELAHLARGDDWAHAGQSIARAVFGFHPLVRWLNRRTDRERELLCDEAVVALGADRLVYARLLFKMARRADGRRIDRRRAVLQPAGLAFLGRGTLEVRVQNLLEADMTHATLSTPRRWSARRALVLGAGAMLAALAVGGLKIQAGAAQEPHNPPVSKKAQPDSPRVANHGPAHPAHTVRITVTGPDGKRVPDADVVAVFTTGIEEKLVKRAIVRTDQNGEITFDAPDGRPTAWVYAYKPGLAPSARYGSLTDDRRGADFNFHLTRPEPFSGTLVDREEKPLAAAKLSIEMVASHRDAETGSTSFEHVRASDLDATPLDHLYTTLTDRQGGFTFPFAPSNSALKLRVVAPGVGAMQIDPRGLFGDPAIRELGMVSRETTIKPIVALPPARIVGRVVTKAPGASVQGLELHLEADDASRRMASAHARADAEGRFVFEDLGPMTVNVYLQDDAAKSPWTARAAEGVRLRPGETAEVELELVRGVEVVGKVVDPKTGEPVPGAKVEAHAASRPESGPARHQATTDAQGRYRFYLPPGEAAFLLTLPPPGYALLAADGSKRSATIPDDVAHFEAPSIPVATSALVKGRVIDVFGKPVVGAKIVGMYAGPTGQRWHGLVPRTDEKGAFEYQTGPRIEVAFGKPLRLAIQGPDGTEHQPTIVLARGEVPTIRLPVGAPANVHGPGEVAPDELAGIVVDPEGNPIEGAEVDAWTWYPGNETRTDRRGWFRLPNLNKKVSIEILVRAPGRTPQLFIDQPTGTRDWVVVLDDQTYFEGTVTAPDGKPVANALVRANNGPKLGNGGSFYIGEIWHEARTDADGRYRLYAQADVYEFQVRVPGIGVARLSAVSLAPNEARRLDVPLQKGVMFRARVVDSLTGKPVSGARLQQWQHPEIEGRSGDDGMVVIHDVLPGPFQFQVEREGYARWWSKQASRTSEREPASPENSWKGWFGNVRPIEFSMAPGMEPVTLIVEPGVKVTGRVVDPEGKPRAGAAVSVAHTGTGNPLTEHVQFNAECDKFGRFTLWLPASGGAHYNLIAHDGKHGQWREWANGVAPPIRTRPGQEIPNVELKLNRPCSVKGQITNADGRPIVGREVRASAADRLGNRYYDPTTKTRADGTYELKFVREGEHLIQVAPFMFDATEAPGWSSRKVGVSPDEEQTGVNFQVPRGEENDR